MSYTYLGASARLRALDSVWTDVDLSAQTLGSLFDTYSGIYFEITHPAYPHSVFLNLRLVRDTLTTADLQLTPQAWLTSIGNTALPVVENLPNPREAWVKYEDGFKAGYNIDLINVGRHIDSQLPEDDKNDLFIRNSKVDFGSMWRYFLTSVNGYFHRCTLGPDGLYVIDGGRTKRIANNNVIGLLSGTTPARTTEPRCSPPPPTAVHCATGSSCRCLIRLTGKRCC